MTLLFIDSFDHYSTSELDRKYTLIEAPAIVTGGRNSTDCLQINSSGELATVAFSQSTTVVVGFAYKPATVSIASRICYFYAAGVNHINLQQSATGQLQLRKGTTVIDTSSELLTVDAWHYIELKITFDNTTGAYEVKVDGNSWFSDTSVDTCTNANEWCDSFAMGLSANQTMLYDDLYICDTSGSVNNDFLGDCRVEAVLPSGAGNSTGWTPSAGNNYECVDDADPDDDTTYCSAATSALKDTHAMGNLVTTSGDVLGVQTVLCSRKDDAGTVTLEPVLRSGSTDYPGTSFNTGDNYDFDLEIEEEDPDTSTAWTISGVNAVEFGYNRSA